MNVHKITENFYDETLIIETGKLAKQADGAVTVQYGDTVLLATVVASRKLKFEDQDFFPLTVDYRERVTAAGKFKGGYLKREARPTQKEVLVCRLTDRPVRPLFQEGFLYDVQVDLMVISADKTNDPDVLAILGASAALSISPIPFNGPIGGVRVGRKDGKLIINPTAQERANSDMDLVMAGSKNGILMVEGHSKFIQEKELLEALDAGYEAIKVQVALQEKLVAMVQPRKFDLPLKLVDPALVQKLKDSLGKDLRGALYIKEKEARNTALKEKLQFVTEKLKEEDPELSEGVIKNAFKEVEKSLLRKIICEEKIRADGRTPTDIRDIWIETNMLPRTHGSCVFTRGETQALAVTTLGGSRDAQRFEDFGEDLEEHFYLHYTFPGYSVGEVKPNRGPGRREIGHGVLAERALRPTVPVKDKFPYTIRITSDILESNGSSSMASVCAGSLAMMDAGVPIKNAVSGIAMGLVKEGDDVVILSDILGLEDALGDMDFKVAGTREGITAFQMDIKIEGISHAIMEQALEQAKVGRLHILDIMDQNLAAPKPLSSNAPRIYNMTIPQEKIGSVIGPGGKIIRALSEKYEVAIDITDDGTVSIQGENSEKANACLKEIELLTSEVEVGKVYPGKIKSIKDFGAFVECLPGKEGLLHISKIASHRINKVSDVLSVGQVIKVTCTEIDQRGRISLSHVEHFEKAP